MKVIIPQDMDYRETVRQLIKILRTWDLGCQADDSTESNQIIQDILFREIELDKEQQSKLLKALPGVTLESRKKWRLDYGIHRGTITSRDTDSSEYNSEVEAREAFKRNKEFHGKWGYVVWYAYLYTPTGEKIVLDSGNSNYR